ncbi:hypothetical protein PO124_31415 [Bacillus licheniformis]|nr:hypothetical protein [Bacillus licheniformis]
MAQCHKFCTAGSAPFRLNMRHPPEQLQIRERNPEENIGVIANEMAADTYGLDIVKEMCMTMNTITRDL